MAITIIVEDGTIVAGANSFVSLVDARAKVEALGLTLDVDDDKANAQLTQAYYQLKRSYQSRLQGKLMSGATGIFPRSGVYNQDTCDYVQNNVIPDEVINAQLSYADSINKGASMNDTASAQEVQSESLDGVGSKTYKNGSSKRVTPSVPAVTQWLQPFMKSSGLTRTDYFYGGAHGC